VRVPTCTFDQLTEAAKRHVLMQGRKFREPDDDWPMSLMLVHPGDERPALVRLPGWVSNSDEAKEALGKALGDLARLTKPLMVAMIQSTWVAPALPDEPDPEQPRVRPADRPDREERVLVIVLDTEIERSHFAAIRRRRRRPPVLGPWEQWPHEHGIAGRLIEPLREALR
jgi:hypothetical protein